MNTFASILRIPVLNSITGGVLNSCRTLFTRPQLPSLANNPNLSLPTPFFGIGGTGSGLLAPAEGLIGGVSGRTNVRNHFPKPSEIKRIKRHGWKARMSTLAGRRVLMRRILKGRHVYSH